MDWFCSFVGVALLTVTAIQWDTIRLWFKIFGIVLGALNLYYGMGGLNV